MVRILILTVGSLLWAGAGFAITGDLNKDGTVNFDDFFLFSDNFGKSGPLEDDCSTEALPPPITMSGSGTQVTEKITLEAGKLYIVRVEKGADSYFLLQLTDGDTGERVETLLNESGGEVNVSASFNVETTKDYLLDISNVTGAWTITISR
jgi:hypothetical protein